MYRNSEARSLAIWPGVKYGKGGLGYQMVEVRGNSCFNNAERGANSFEAMLKGEGTQI